MRWNHSLGISRISFVCIEVYPRLVSTTLSNGTYTLTMKRKQRNRGKKWLAKEIFHQPLLSWSPTQNVNYTIFYTDGVMNILHPPLSSLSTYLFSWSLASIFCIAERCHAPFLYYVWFFVNKFFKFVWHIINDESGSHNQTHSSFWAWPTCRGLLCVIRYCWRTYLQAL